ASSESLLYVPPILSGCDARVGLSLLFAQQVGETRRRHRRTETEPLILIAAETLEQGELLFGLHALGDHLQMQAVRQRHDRFHDRGIVGPRYQLGDEAAIDLQLVDRKAAQ